MFIWICAVESSFESFSPLSQSADGCLGFLPAAALPQQCRCKILPKMSARPRASSRRSVQASAAGRSCLPGSTNNVTPVITHPSLDSPPSWLRKILEWPPHLSQGQSVTQPKLKINLLRTLKVLFKSQPLIISLKHTTPKLPTTLVSASHVCADAKRDVFFYPLATFRLPQVR